MIFLYCALCDKKYVNEVIYSVKSLLNSTTFIPDQVQIIIITDMSDLFSNVFQDYQYIKYEEVTKTIIEEWLGGSTNNFRLKIKAIEFILEKYQRNCIFFDSDTIINKDINYLLEIVNSGKFIMHSKCVSIDKALEIFNNISDKKNMG